MYNDNERMQKDEKYLLQNKQKTLRERVNELNFNIQRFIDDKKAELQELEQQEKAIMKMEEK